MTGPPNDSTSVIEPDQRNVDRRAVPPPDYEEPESWDDARGRAMRRVQQEERRRRRRRFIAVSIVLALLILPFIIAVGWFYFQLEPRGAQGAAVSVTVEDGWSTTEVGNALAAADVVDSALAFRIWATVTGAGPFRPGNYTFNANMGARDATNVLKVPAPAVAAGPDATLLLPPGLTVNQIADRIGQLPGHTKEGFLAVVNSGTIRSKYMPANVTSLEGFLFPDTYFIGASEDDAAIVRKLVARFDEIGDRIGLANSAATNGLTPYDTVVAASLIQTEAKLADDAPLISAVIRNRLRDRMPLQIDSTLCYAKGGCPPVPTNADKSIDSPYNTYKVSGLPPTPIASVTETNLKAAMFPADVPYKFYVLIDANGKHKFATTLAEHEANVREAKAKGVL